MQFPAAFVLVALSVIVHAIVLTKLLAKVSSSPLVKKPRFWPSTRFLIIIAYWAIFAHLIEISLWSMFYYWWSVMPDIESSFYFSVMTYTTIGYGDVVPPIHWRLLAGVEGLTGILMCGWTTAFFLTIVNRMYQSMSEFENHRDIEP
jgi:hypothetical protein